MNDFGRTLEKLTRKDALNVIPSASDSMIKSWQELNPAIVEKACIQYLRSRDYLITRIT